MASIINQHTELFGKLSDGFTCADTILLYHRLSFVKRNA